MQMDHVNWEVDYNCSVILANMYLTSVLVKVRPIVLKGLVESYVGVWGDRRVVGYEKGECG